MTADEGQGSETGDGERLKVIVVEDERGRGSFQNIPCFTSLLLSIFRHISFRWTKKLL